MTTSLKLSIVANVFLFGSTTYYYAQNTQLQEAVSLHEKSAEIRHQQTAEATTTLEATNRPQSADTLSRKEKRALRKTRRGILAKERLSMGQRERSETDIAQRIEERAEEIANAKIAERRAEKMDRITERMEEGVRTVSEEFGWDDEQTNTVLEIVLERLEDWSLLRAELEAGDITREEMHEERKRRSEDRKTRIVDLVGQDAAKRLKEELTPPHRR
ncbi:MAG: hypothetical protein VX278_19265 [Myxococcota bacterium]|nr:hypothetical protein [Myxococcota bacterium]